MQTCNLRWLTQVVLLMFLGISCSQAPVLDPPTQTLVPTITPNQINTATHQPDTPFKIWLKQASCGTACWGKILLGVTSSAQAQEFLFANDLVDDLEISNSNGIIRWNTAGDNISAKLIFDIHSETRIADLIEFEFKQPVSTTEVIQAYSDPSHILALATESGEGVTTYSTWLIYRDQGLLFINNGKGNPDFQINNNLGLNRIILYSPNEEGLAQAINQYWGWEFVGNLILPWHGFGEYKEYCRIYEYPEGSNLCLTPMP